MKFSQNVVIDVGNIYRKRNENQAISSWEIGSCLNFNEPNASAAI